MKKAIIAVAVVGIVVCVARSIGKGIEKALTEGVKTAAEEAAVKVLENKD